MAVTWRWVTRNTDDLRKVSEARLRADGAGSGQREKFAITEPPDGQEHLLAEENGRPVAVTTAIDQRIWVRGAAFDCQGVAWVGTVRTHRRGTGPQGRGIASTLMQQTVRRARQRQQPLTALMPFRVSFYEHFGYGVVERRHDWLIPLSVLPAGDFSGLRYLERADLPELMRPASASSRPASATWSARARPGNSGSTAGKMVLPSSTAMAMADRCMAGPPSANTPTPAA